MHPKAKSCCEQWWTLYKKGQHVFVDLGNILYKLEEAGITKLSKELRYGISYFCNNIYLHLDAKSPKEATPFIQALGNAGFLMYDGPKSSHPTLDWYFYAKGDKAKKRVITLALFFPVEGNEEENSCKFVPRTEVKTVTTYDLVCPEDK